MRRIQGKGFRLDSGFDELSERLQAAVGQRLRVAGEALKTQVQRNVGQSARRNGPSQPGEYPRANTGKLRQSYFSKETQRNVEVQVGTPLLVGLWMETGLDGGKIIQAKNGRALSWIDAKTGERRFAKRVRQGRLIARAPLARTLREQEAVLRRILEAPLPAKALEGIVPR